MTSRVRYVGGFCSRPARCGHSSPAVHAMRWSASGIAELSRSTREPLPSGGRSRLPSRRDVGHGVPPSGGRCRRRAAVQGLQLPVAVPPAQHLHGLIVARGDRGHHGLEDAPDPCSLPGTICASHALPNRISGMMAALTSLWLLAFQSRYPLILTRIFQCALKARFTSGGRFHPESCRLLW